jgi:4-amino-4-deoxy-L-arabinose transferase-like glycosyltransferase
MTDAVDSESVEEGVAGLRRERVGAALRRHAVWVTVIFAVALATRVFWVVYAPADPTDGRGTDDTMFYHGAAMELAEGDGYVLAWTEIDTAQWPPGYSLLLSGFYLVMGPKVSIGWGINVVLGALTCVALYSVGCLAASRRVGALAGLLLAVLPGHVFFSSLLLSEVLFAFLVVAAMALMLLVSRSEQGRKLPLVIALGAVIGLAALVRGQGLLLIPVAFLFWWIHAAGFTVALERVLLAALVAVALIVPWTVRNYLVMDRLIFISTNDGLNLYMGNHEGATGGFMIGAAVWIVDMYKHLPVSEREVRASDKAMQEGLEFMFTHPLDELRLAGSKLRFLYDDDKEALEWIHAPEAGKPLESRDVISNIANGFYFTVLAVSAGGLLVWLRRPRGALSLPVVLIALFTLGQLLFFAVSRFHFPMLPSFCLLAAAGAIAAFDWIAARRPRMMRADG